MKTVIERTSKRAASILLRRAPLLATACMLASLVGVDVQAQADPTSASGGKRPFIIMLVDTSASMEYSLNANQDYACTDTGTYESCRQASGDSTVNPNQGDDPNEPVNFIWSNQDALGDSDGDPLDRAASWGNKDYEDAGEGPTFVGPCYVWKDQCDDYSRPPWAPTMLDDGEANNDEFSYDMAMWERLRYMRGRVDSTDPSALDDYSVSNKVRRLQDSNQPRHVQLKEILTGDMILSPYDTSGGSLASGSAGFVANPQIHGPGCWFVPRMSSSRAYQSGWHACQQVTCKNDGDCRNTPWTGMGADPRNCTGNPGICVRGGQQDAENAFAIECTNNGQCNSIQSGLRCTGNMGNPGVCVPSEHTNAMHFIVDHDDPRPHFQEVYDYQLNTGLLDNLSNTAIFAVAMFDGYQGESQNLMDMMSPVVDPNSANPVSPIVNDGIPDTNSGAFAVSPDLLGAAPEGISKYDLGIYKVVGPSTLDVPTSQLNGLSQFTQYAISDAGYLRNHTSSTAAEWLIDPADSSNSRLNYNIPSGLEDYATPYQMGHQPIAGGTPLAAAIRDIHRYMLRGQYEFDHRGRALPTSTSYDPEVHTSAELADPSNNFIINPVQQDKYRECRPKHVVLMTDGFPSPEVGATEAGELNLGSNELGDAFGFPDSTNRYVYSQAEKEINALVNDPALTPSPKPYQSEEDFMPFVHIVGLNLIDDSTCMDDSECRGGLVCTKLNNKNVCAADEDNNDIPDVPQKMGRMAAEGRTCAQYFLVTGDGKKYVPSDWPAMDGHTGTCDPSSGNCLVKQFDENDADVPLYKNDANLKCLAPALILEKNDSKTTATMMGGGADVRDDLTEALSLVFNEVLEQSNGIASRTRATVTNNLDAKELRGQYRVFSGTSVVGSSVYWQGLLERQTIACSRAGGSIDGLRERSLHEDINNQVEPNMLSPTGYRDNRRIFTSFEGSDTCSGCNTTIASSASLQQLTASEDQFGATRFGTSGNALGAMTRVPLELDDMLAIRGVAATPTPSDLTFLNVVDEQDGVRTIAEVRGHIPQKQGRQLGAILNSNPVTVGPPSLNLPNASYRAYREKYGQRATMLYVSTLDGMLHAIHTGPHDDESNNGIIRRTMSGSEGTSPQSVCAGTDCSSSQREAWAYVPNMLLTELPNYKNRQPNLLDGTPVVNDVRLCHGDGTLNQSKQACAAAGATVAPEDQWRSVLVQGLGQAGSGYFALDVTHTGGIVGGVNGNAPDPIPLWEVNPKWEEEQIALLGSQPSRFGYTSGSVANPLPSFSVSDTDCDSSTPSDLLETPFMGLSVGEPAIGTVVLEGIKSGANVQRPVAIFSGGLNGSIPGSESCRVNARRGRAVYVVDLQTGALLRRFVDYNSDGTYYRFEAEVAGTPVLYDNRPGVVASRAFVGDLAGRLFRIDLSSADPSDWKMDLFYDPCTDSQVDTGDSCDLLDGTELRNDPGRTFGPAMFPPTVALDSQRRPTVVYGLGERNDTSTANQVQAMVALRDNVDPSDKIAWSTTFPENTSEDYNEKLTGQPVIFNFGVYFTTYRENNIDPCEPGRSRIWGLRLGGDPENPGKIAGALDFSASDSTALTDVDWPSDQDPATDLLRWYSPVDPLLIRGVTIAFRPSCNIDFDNPGVNTDEGEEATPELIATTGASDGASNSNYNNNDPGDFSSGQAGSLSFEIKKLATPRSRLEPLSWSVIGY